MKLPRSAARCTRQAAALPLCSSARPHPRPWSSSAAFPTFPTFPASPASSLASSSPATPRTTPPPAVNLNDTSVGYASKTTPELLRGLLVLALCRDTVVSRADKLLNAGRQVLGDTITEALLRHTFFAHFCAGETEPEARATMERLSALKRVATCLVETRRLFSRIATGDEPSARQAVTMSRDAFRRGYNGFFFNSSKPNEADVYFDSIIAKSVARGLQTPPDDMDLLDWVTSMTPREAANLASRCTSRGPFSSSVLTAAELDLVDSCLGRMNRLAALAKAQGARIMIDAEQSYFQPAIDSITLDLQRQHNAGERAVVFGTYQAYLKDALERVRFDLKRAQREDWRFACKVVRGAYLISENKLAQDSGAESPIQPSLEATAESYLKCAQTLMQARAEVVIASHNADSIAAVLREMRQTQTPEGLVSFAQLKGMSDHLTFALANAHLPVYKYLPFGPVHAVVPYLIRRGQENSAVAGGFKRERDAVAKELRRRWGV
jgi:hypothetical protein